MAHHVSSVELLTQSFPLRSSHAQEAAAELLRVGALEKSRLSLVDFNRTTEVTTVQKISCDKNMLWRSQDVCLGCFLLAEMSSSQSIELQWRFSSSQASTRFPSNSAAATHMQRAFQDTWICAQWRSHLCGFRARGRWVQSAHHPYPGNADGIVGHASTSTQFNTHAYQYTKYHKVHQNYAFICVWYTGTGTSQAPAHRLILWVLCLAESGTKMDKFLFNKWCKILLTD